MKRIAWITPRCFVETDIYAIELLARYFSIDWFIIEENKCSEYEDRIALLNSNGVSVRKMILPGRNRNFKVLVFYYKLLCTIRRTKYDLVYNAIFGMPYYMPLEALLIEKSKIIIALHNVTIPKGSKASVLPSKLYTSFVSHMFENYHTFSLAQCEILKKRDMKKNVFHIPFVLKDYGSSSLKPLEAVTFLFFGQILEYKRLDVLIRAAEAVFDRTNIKFKVKIAGSCPYWERYEHLIHHHDLFDLTIRRIDNCEIPDLFSSCHYFVMPYQDIAQSGALVVAINYGLPVIASKLPSFEEYIEDRNNGFLIKPANEDDLEKILSYIIINHNLIYPMLKLNMSRTRDNRFSSESIKGRYMSEFNKILNSKC